MAKIKNPVETVEIPVLSSACEVGLQAGLKAIPDPPYPSRAIPTQDQYNRPRLPRTLIVEEVQRSKQSSLYDPESCEHQDTADAAFLIVCSKGSPREKMPILKTHTTWMIFIHYHVQLQHEREDNRVQSVRNTQEANRRPRPRQEGRRSSGPSDSPWIEPEIWIFLQEWEVVEYKMGKPGEKMFQKAKSLSRRLSKRRLRKSWKSCLDLMLQMKDLHETLCHERARPDPLFSPYAWDLYKILGHRSQRGHFPGPWCDGRGFLPADQTPYLCIGGADSPGLSPSPWTDLEIRIFLQQWEAVELGHPGQKMEKKTSAVFQRLHQLGLSKTFESCLDLMLSLQDLHRTLCNERPGTIPLFSPYAEALYRILGHKCQGGPVPGALYGWSGNSLSSMEPQHPMVMPSPVYQSWDDDMSAPSAQLHGNPSLMMSSQHSMFPSKEAWNATYPLTVPHGLPASLPGDTNLQMPWSTWDDTSSSQ
ncbi:uncharacterized protein LOC127676245 [Apodemus sylvaticus]|uniref:uncharacterized protein LOC127676245 n=1 Tax=Apodemus sylvaticus TaxID=10129 RepID=UPI002241E37A|nr:uncharacterized protein LOC127676245 [Apodemus sylvaticus]